MIKAGRKVLDRLGVGAAHGLSETAAVRSRPWASPGHPQPVNRPGGRKGGLWDQEQVHAYVAGDPVPSLPTEPHPDDLLDASEAAELAEVAEVTWTRYVERGGIVPEPDEEVFGQRHWRRTILEEWKPSRPGRGSGGGRRPKNGLSEQELLDRAAAVVQAAADAGRKPSAREIGREIGVSPTKASRLLGALNAGES